MRIERFLVYALVALVGLYLLAVDGLIDDAMEVKFDRPSLSIVADCGNGLNATHRASFHHVSHG